MAPNCSQSSVDSRAHNFWWILDVFNDPFPNNVVIEEEGLWQSEAGSGSCNAQVIQHSMCCVSSKLVCCFSLLLGKIVIDTGFLWPLGSVNLSEDRRRVLF